MKELMDILMRLKDQKSEVRQTHKKIQRIKKITASKNVIFSRNMAGVFF